MVHHKLTKSKQERNGKNCLRSKSTRTRRQSYHDQVCKKRLGFVIENCVLETDPALSNYLRERADISHISDTEIISVHINMKPKLLPFTSRQQTRFSCQTAEISREAHNKGPVIWYSTQMLHRLCPRLQFILLHLYPARQVWQQQMRNDRARQF